LCFSGGLGGVPSTCSILSGLVVSGPTGVGKSAIVAAAAMRLSGRSPSAGPNEDAPHRRGRRTPPAAVPPVWAALVPASALRSPQPAASLAKLRTFAQRAARSAPSLLILDKLHEVFPAAPSGPSPPDAVPLAEGAAEILASLAHARLCAPVCVVAIVPATSRLHEALRAPGLFDTEVPVAPPDTQARRRAFAAICRGRDLRASSDVRPTGWHS